MIFDTNKEKGRAGMALAIAYFGANGYTVSIPLNDTQDYDLIVDKDDKLLKVQVKFTGTKENERYRVKLMTNGRNKNYGTVKDSSVDILFVVTSNKDTYLIPKEVITQVSNVRLTDIYDKYKVEI
ncbi:MAG: hypothetical protein J6D12_07810 [Peptostreptococcaceae bacterium]|nr:hypothetical protein [Peptostreptococcaceae bacterium]